jgi:histidinol-phosphate phosphatase family protein
VSIAATAATRPGGEPAVLLDRDGTLIADRHFLADPAGIEILPGVPQALARLRAAGYQLVVVTNQSGVARGLVTVAQYEAVRARLDALLAAAGASIAATYMCPHDPTADGPCECRKPGAGMFRAAARDLGLDLTRSFLVGDRWRDIAAAAALGARGILIPTPDTAPEDVATARDQMTVAPTLAAAADGILTLTGGAPGR